MGLVDVDDKHSAALSAVSQRRLLLLASLPLFKPLFDQLTLTLLVLQLSTHVAPAHLQRTSPQLTSQRAAACIEPH